MKEPDFEGSADMRLLELQRGALGLPARERTAWETPAASEGSLPLQAAAGEPIARGAVLTVEALAHPAGEVIPGAVVSLSLSVSNEGAASADGIVAGAPLPGGASYRPGSFVWNGRSSFDDVAESFFGAGLPIGSLGPGERASFHWKIGVKLGVKPLLLAPYVRSTSAAVLGARPLSIGRKAATVGPFAAELGHASVTASTLEAKPLIPVDIPATELPFYELDSEEEIVAEAAMAALSTAAPKYVPPAPEPIAAAAPEPEPVVEAPPEVAEAMPEPEPEPEPTPLKRVREAVVLYGRFDRATISFFERVFFGTKTPTILQHCILSGALACTTEPNPGQGAELKRHLDAQSQGLHRIALHEKLGKKEPIADYAGELVAQIDRLRPAPLGEVEVPKETLLLATELSEPTLAVLQRLAEERARWDFVKARQLTLALQAESVDAHGIDEALRAQIATALRAYAQASVTVLQKLFVRMRIDRTTGVLSQTDPTLDAAARSLISAFKLALP